MSMRYNEWEPRRWDTLISDGPRIVFLHSLVSIDFGLELILSVGLNNNEQFYQLQFEVAPAYRIVWESFRNALWRKFPNWNTPDSFGSKLGYTWIVEKSPWIKDFRDEDEDENLEFLYEGIQHYVIVTEYEVVEVLSHLSPSVIQIPKPTNID